MSNRQDVVRRIEPGLLELDKERSVLIVNYNIHAEVTDGNGTVLKSKTEDKRKEVPVEINEHTDIEELAEHIVKAQKYLPSQKLPKVIKLLKELQKYTIKNATSSSKRSKRDKKKKRSKHRSSKNGGSNTAKKVDSKEEDDESKEDESKTDEAAKPTLQVKIEELDDYLDALYNDDYKVGCPFEFLSFLFFLFLFGFGFVSVWTVDVSIQQQRQQALLFLSNTVVIC